MSPGAVDARAREDNYGQSRSATLVTVTCISASRSPAEFSTLHVMATCSFSRAISPLPNFVIVVVLPLVLSPSAAILVLLSLFAIVV